MKRKCFFMAHAGSPAGSSAYWDHAFDDNGAMWGTGIQIGQRCQCGKTKWTKADRDRNNAAIEHITTDSNLNRM